MIKRISLALAFLVGLLSPAYSAGTISLSLMQQFGTDNKPLNGGKLYFYAAGTTTPQNAYQDSGLTIPWPNPYTLDATGRIPQLFFADGQIKVRLTNSVGVVQLAADNLLVVGPSGGGGGGGGSVDATTVLATGDIKSRYGTGVLTGFVRLNGRTIGSATSGATERANADTQSLFEYLWGADTSLSVSTGRGASANADWVANKTITLPDGRGRVLAALDDMGNTAAGRLTSTYFGVGFSSNGTTLGAVGGNESQTLGFNQLPVFTPTFTGSSGGVSVSFNLGSNYFVVGQPVTSIQASGSGSLVPANAGGFTSINNFTSTGSFTPVGTISQIGGGNAHTIVQPTILVTNYIKL